MYQKTYMRFMRSSGVGNCLFLRARGWGIDLQERKKLQISQDVPEGHGYKLNWTMLKHTTYLTRNAAVICANLISQYPNNNNNNNNNNSPVSQANIFQYVKIIVYICIRLVRCFLLSSKLSHVRRIVFIRATNQLCDSFLYRSHCSFNRLDEV